MRTKRWTRDEIDFLRKHYLTMPLEEIAAALGRTRSQTKSAASNHGINGKRRNFTEFEIEMVKRLYPDTPTAEVARQISRTIETVYRLAHKLGVEKSEAYLEEKRRVERERLTTAGVGHRYSKGHVPANKGLRRPGYIRGRMAETQFKKGQRSCNWKPIGSERISSRDGYILVKVTEGQRLNYKLKHKIVWEQHHGPVPKGHVVAFKDRNKLNCSIENLELITKKENMLRNTMHNYPEPVRSMIHTLAGYKRKLNTHAKKQNRRSSEPVVSDDGAAAGRG